MKNVPRRLRVNGGSSALKARTCATIFRVSVSLIFFNFYFSIFNSLVSAQLVKSVDSVGITVGSAQRIVADLIEAGFLERTREGRRNRYVINRDSPMLRHAAQDDQEIGGLVELLERDGAQ